jgi:hypothetical protein
VKVFCQRICTNNSVKSTKIFKSCHDHLEEVIWVDMGRNRLDKLDDTVFAPHLKRAKFADYVAIMDFAPHLDFYL